MHSNQFTAKGSYSVSHSIEHGKVLDTLKQHMLVDGFNIVLDTDQSRFPYLRDALTGKDYLDFFTFFASMPLGFNHPKLLDPKFIDYIGKIAINKPSNSDIYTEAMAKFVSTFHRLALPDYFRYSFYICGGALAVENALKTAFDWKVRKNFRKGHKSELGQQIIHFRQSFHGRSGYTLSLTNTDPQKTNYFPKFDWPRIVNPILSFPSTPESLENTIRLENQAVAEIKKAFADNPDDIAAIIIEPIQGEGGDNHFRPEFMQSLRNLADENDALLIFDEIQTGVGITGKWWAHQHTAVKPDIMVFGKKMQICGIAVTDRIDDIEDNVFHTSSRINSTWGGNLTDMVRATKYLEIITEDHLVENAESVGDFLLKNLSALEEVYPDYISNVRGKGLFCAFDIVTPDKRKKFLDGCFAKGLFILACGNGSVRFRPPLNISKDHIAEGINIIREVLESI